MLRVKKGHTSKEELQNLPAVRKDMAGGQQHEAKRQKTWAGHWVAVPRTPTHECWMCSVTKMPASFKASTRFKIFYANKLYKIMEYSYNELWKELWITRCWSSKSQISSLHFYKHSWYLPLWNCRGLTQEIPLFQYEENRSTTSKVSHIITSLSFQKQTRNDENGIIHPNYSLSFPFLEESCMSLIFPMWLTVLPGGKGILHCHLIHFTLDHVTH